MSRYPVPIDRELEFEEGRRMVAVKFLSRDEPIFEEHFPERSVYPGAMVLHSVFAAVERLQNRPCVLKTAKFRKPALPGDLLRVEAEVEPEKGEIKFRVDEFFGGALLCHGKFVFEDEEEEEA
jgi:3-hydroxyacyl-[acyl-carrier-protein] dehydratase